jgi:thioesterase domain-containing protein
MPLVDATDLRWLRQRRATVRALSGLLDVVLPLRVADDADAPPLFCAPPVVGLSWCYLALLGVLPAGNPLYGLQSRALARPEPLPVGMPELARDFADQIRRTQPGGPYRLLGWSLGGTVAFAVARELEARGHEVGLLAVLDAGPSVDEKLSGGVEQAWLWYNFVLGEFGYPPLVEADEPEPEAATLALIRSRPGLGLTEWPDRQILRLLRVIRNNVAAARAFRPGRVRCPVLLFAATGSGPSTAEKAAAWGAVAEGPVDVVEVGCRHEHMLLPGPLAVIGAVVSERLAKSSGY